MMKIKYLIIMLFMIFILPLGVLADGNISVSTSNINITKGGSSSFVITANNSAGRIDIKSSNPSVASVSQDSLFLDMSNSTIIVSGNSAGSAIITVYVSDVTTYDDEDLSGKTYSINVNVAEPVINHNKKLSDNNNVKSIKAEGFELEKIGGQEFKLSVMNNVTSINIIADLEDNKASISGDGVRELKVGSNIIDIIVTSESGKQKKYVLNITRKEGYYIEDLVSIMENLAEKNVSVKIDADSILSSDILKKIKNSGKQVDLNYSDENNKLIYSWLIDGDKIVDTNDFLTSVSYISEYKEDIEKLTNYADGLYINIKNNNKLPAGSMIKLNVGDKFESGEMVKLYCYNPKNNDLNFVMDELTVKDKYIQFGVNDCSNYFVTMSTVKNNDTNSKLFYVIGIFVIAALCFTIFILLRNKSKRNKNDNTKNNDVKNIDINLHSVDNTTNDIDVINENNVVNTVSDNNNIVINNDVVDNHEIDNVNSDVDESKVISSAISNLNVETDVVDNETSTDLDSFVINNLDVETDNDSVETQNNNTVVNNEINNDTNNLEETSVIDNLNNEKVEDNLTFENVVNDTNSSNVLNNVSSEISDDDNVVTFGGYNIDLGDNNI